MQRSNSQDENIARDLESNGSASETTVLLSKSTVVQDDHLNQARRLLYVSHAFSQFSESAWQFALILFLAAFSNYQSLFLISTYGLTSGLSICLFGASAGRFVDTSNRLYAARFFIWTENLGVVIATALCYILLSMERDYMYDTRSVLLLLGIHFFGSLATILDKGFLVAIERDWVVDSYNHRIVVYCHCPV